MMMTMMMMRVIQRKKTHAYKKKIKNIRSSEMGI